MLACNCSMAGTAACRNCPNAANSLFDPQPEMHIAPYWVENTTLAAEAQARDAAITSLRAELAAAKLQIENLESTNDTWIRDCRSLNEKLAARDAEIARLRDLCHELVGPDSRINMEDKP